MRQMAACNYRHLYPYWSQFSVQFRINAGSIGGIAFTRIQVITPMPVRRPLPPCPDSDYAANKYADIINHDGHRRRQTALRKAALRFPFERRRKNTARRRRQACRFISVRPTSSSTSARTGLSNRKGENDSGARRLTAASLLRADRLNRSEGGHIRNWRTAFRFCTPRTHTTTTADAEIFLPVGSKPVTAGRSAKSDIMFGIPIRQCARRSMSPVLCALQNRKGFLFGRNRFGRDHLLTRRHGSQ